MMMDIDEMSTEKREDTVRRYQKQIKLEDPLQSVTNTYVEMELRVAELEKRIKVEKDYHGKSKIKLDAILRRNAELRAEIERRMYMSSAKYNATSNSVYPILKPLKQEPVEVYDTDGLVPSSDVLDIKLTETHRLPDTLPFPFPAETSKPVPQTATLPVELLMVEEKKPIISDQLDEIVLTEKITEETARKIVSNLWSPSEKKNEKAETVTNDRIFPIFRRAKRSAKSVITSENKGATVRHGKPETTKERLVKNPEKTVLVKPKRQPPTKRPLVATVSTAEEKAKKQSTSKKPSLKETIAKAGRISRQSNSLSNLSPSVPDDESEDSSSCDSSDEYDPEVEERMLRGTKSKLMTTRRTAKNTTFAARQPNTDKLKEQDKAGQKRQSELRKRYNANLTKEDQENVVEMHKIYYANLSEEEKKRRERRKEQRRKMSEATREYLKQYNRNRYRNLVNQGYKQINKKYPAEVIQRWRLAAKRRFENLPEEKKKIIVERQIKYRKEYWAKITKEKKRQLEIRRKERFNMLSEAEQKDRMEHRKAQAKKRREERKLELANTEEGKARMERIRQYQKEYRKNHKMSEEQKRKRALRALEKYKNMSAEERKKLNERQREREKRNREKKKIKSGLEGEKEQEKARKRARPVYRRRKRESSTSESGTDTDAEEEDEY